MGHSGRQLAVQLHVNASRPVGQNRGIPPCKLNLQTELSFSRSIRSSRLKHWRLRREYAACPQRRIFLGLLCSGYPIEERKKVCFSLSRRRLQWRHWCSRSRQSFTLVWEKQMPRGEERGRGYVKRYRKLPSHSSTQLVCNWLCHTCVCIMQTYANIIDEPSSLFIKVSTPPASRYRMYHRR